MNFLCSSPNLYSGTTQNRPKMSKNIPDAVSTTNKYIWPSDTVPIGKARNPFIAYTEHIARESTWTRLNKIPRVFHALPSFLLRKFNLWNYENISSGFRGKVEEGGEGLEKKTGYFKGKSIVTKEYEIIVVSVVLPLTKKNTITQQCQQRTKKYRVLFLSGIYI